MSSVHSATHLLIISLTNISPPPPPFDTLEDKSRTFSAHFRLFLLSNLDCATRVPSTSVCYETQTGFFYTARHSADSARVAREVARRAGRERSSDIGDDR